MKNKQISGCCTDLWDSNTKIYGNKIEILDEMNSFV